jgi:DNA-binding CsgD family transcriptional regulator
VLRLVAEGMTNAQIARELYISSRTVNAHLRSVYHKIGFSTRAEAPRFALLMAGDRTAGLHYWTLRTPPWAGATI